MRWHGLQWQSTEAVDTTDTRARVIIRQMLPFQNHRNPALRQFLARQQ